MNITCPYCGHEMVLKGAAPGRFSPRCAACDHRFQLTIPTDPNSRPQIFKLPPDAARPRKQQAPAAGQSAATMPPSPVRAPDAPAQPIAAPKARAAPVPQPHAQTVVTGTPAQIAAEGRAASLGSLGGYDLIRQLGEGGMGTVYLARQVSLNRLVAVKTLTAALSQDPQFISRFCREAYAAAQLTHHNVVQIHDIGLDQGINYFSMEYVEGQSLAAVTRQAGHVDARTAVLYTLQAARGLAFAHEHGMIHRDVKPDNLLLTPQGIVKVADLGLVKHQTESSSAPSPNLAAAMPAVSSATMGTPAYMPPEQSTDAAHVDQRADIYALGCTLYDLVTGRPPFTGQTALEVITKHQREPILPPDLIVKDLPKSLSAVIMRMVAKRPEDRYPTMNVVIDVLENFLGFAGESAFTPKAHQIEAIKDIATQYRQTAGLGIRTGAIAAFWCVALAACFFGKYGVAAAILWTVSTLVTYQITRGIGGRSEVYTRFRQFVLGSSPREWLGYIAAICAVGLLIWAMHLAFLALIVLLLSISAATTLYFSVDVPIYRDRAKPLADAEHLLFTMRMHAMEENSVRHFVFGYTAENWEEFYEALFGYDAKMTARQLWAAGELGKRRRFGGWRDPIIRWIDQRQTQRRENAERRLLARLEAEALAVAGVDRGQARKQADESANRLIRGAAELRVASMQRMAATALPPETADRAARKAVAATLQPKAASAVLHRDVRAKADPAIGDGFHAVVGSRTAAAPAPARRQSDKLSITDLVAGDVSVVTPRQHEGYVRRRYGTPLDFAVGPQVRCLLAIIILVAFGAWWFQTSRPAAEHAFNQLVAPRQDAPQSSGSTDKGPKALQAAQKEIAASTVRPPLQSKYVPTFIAPYLSSYAAGLAGLLLLLSVFFYGRMLGILILAAAFVSIAGQPWIVAAAPQPPPAWTAAAASVFVWVFAVMFFRAKD